ncbi:MAG: hypothetical protein HOC09_39090 [Deltaproteobacteria bacterium]|nr:hypothetical protein [Deltaproteobacteria bacterium]
MMSFLKIVEDENRTKIVGKGKPIILVYGMGGPGILDPVADQISKFMVPH